jgi:hypothetical protein
MGTGGWGNSAFRAWASGLGAVLLTLPAGADSPLAWVGARAITMSDFAEHCERILDASQRARLASDPALRRETLDGLLDGFALETRARKAGIDREPAFRLAVSLLEKKLLARAWALQDAGTRTGVALPAEAEILAWYETHPGSYAMPEVFTARQVLVFVRGNPAFPDRGFPPEAALARAREALAHLQAGESWETVTARYSEDLGTRRRGGLMLDAPFGFQPPELETALRTQPLGELGQPLRTAFGYHVLLVLARTPPGTRRPLAEVREDIAHRLLEAKASELRAAARAKARRLAGLNPRPAAALPFGPRPVSPGEILADLEDHPLTEAGFQDFFRDAFRPAQRAGIQRTPGARPALVSDWLDLEAQAALARRQGLDLGARFGRDLMAGTRGLLGEFVLEREGQALRLQPGRTEAEKAAGLRRFLDRVQTEAGVRYPKEPLAPDPGSRTAAPLGLRPGGSAPR